MENPVDIPIASAKESGNPLSGHYKAIYENNPDFVVLFDRSGRCLDANPATLKRINVTAAEFVQLNLSVITTPEDTARLLNLLAAVFDQQQTISNYLIEYPLPNCSSEYFEVSLTPLLENGIVTAALAYGKELTAQKKAEHLLRKSAQEYRALIEDIPDVVFRLDEGGCFTYLNPAMGRYGYRVPDLIGVAFTSLLGSADQAHAQAAIQRCLNGKAESAEYRLTGPGGTSHPILASFQPAAVRAGGPKTTSGMLIDITPTHQFKNTLERRVAQLNLLNQIGAKISSTLEIEPILTGAVDLVQKGFGYFQVAIYTPSSETGAPVLRALAESSIKHSPFLAQPGSENKSVNWVFSNHRTLLTDYAHPRPTRAGPTASSLPILATLCVPILNGETLGGVLEIQSPTAKAFDENDIRVIETVASQLAIAIENSRLYQETRLQLHNIERAEQAIRLQRDLLARLNTAPDYQTVLEQIIAAIKPAGVIDSGSLHLADPAHGLLGVAHAGISAEFVEVYKRLPLDAKLTQITLAAQPRYLDSGDIDSNPHIPAEIRARRTVQSVAIIPLLDQQTVVAALTLSACQATRIPDEIREILEGLACHLGPILIQIKTEMALAQSEARSRAILDAIPDLVFILDAQGHFIDTKTAPDTNLLLPREQYLGKRFQDILPPDVAQLLSAYLRLALETNTLQEFEYPLQFANGETRYFDARLCAIPDQSAIILARDITARRRADQQRSRLLELEQALTRISLDLSTASTMEPMVSDLLAKTSQILQAPHAWLAKIDLPERNLSPATHIYPPGSAEVGEEDRLQPAWAELILNDQTVVIHGDESDALTHSLKNAPAKAVLAVPVYVQAQLYGTMVYEQNDRPRKWTQPEIDFVTAVARLVGQAIERLHASQGMSKRIEVLEQNNRHLLELTRPPGQLLPKPAPAQPI